MVELLPTDAAAEQALEARARALVWDGPFTRLPTAELLPTLAIVSDDDGLRRALLAGARGAVFRDTDTELLVGAVVAVALGLCAFEPEMLATLGDRRARSEDDAGLTTREREVLGLLAQGFSNRELAQHLHISEHTAKFHVNAILGKLGADTRTEAVVLAARRGLVMI
jgi:two-component system, NarL family, nitrate/nitrite response regulator NarL